MTRRTTGRFPIWAVAVTSLSLLGAQAVAQEPQQGVDWPQFRGVRASGVADGFEAPIRWNAETGENILWKTPVPGLGHSSPVVWGDLVCVTTADSGQADELKVGLYGSIEPVANETAQRREVYCFDKTTGAERWTALAHQGLPAIPRHPKSTHANSTLATDGTHLVAMFGSEGLYGYDLETGRELWNVDLGVLDSGFFNAPTALWGYAASPIIHDGLVVIQADVLTGSFLAALNVATGDEIWRVGRNDVPTWSTPTVHVVDDRAQVVVNGYRHIGGYDLATGREIWRMAGGGDIPTPTPVVDDGLIFLTNAHGSEAPIFAISEGASGDITPTDGALATDHLVWSQRRDGGYMQTPIVYDGLLYNCRDNGVLGVYERRTGRRHYQQRIGSGGSGFTASPVAADGKVYFSSEDGSIYVVKAGPAFEVLAENPMGETLMATPALSEGVMYVRTRGHLVAIGGGAALASTAAGQEGAADTPERFIGAFRLVSFVTYDDAGNPTTTPYTEGVIMYDASGRMGVHLMDPTRTGRDDGGYIAYFGAYEVDVAEGVVRHLIEGSLGIGAGPRTAVRYFRFEDDGNTLILEVRNDGRVTGTVRWQRYR